MARLEVVVTLTISRSVEVEIPGWTLGDHLSDDDRQIAYEAIADDLTKEDCFPTERDDYEIANVVRESDVEIPKVQAPKHDDMWGEDDG